MKLYTQTTGSGPNLVLIHGWGLHGGIWDTLVPRLEPDFRVTRVDLPGHGRSVWQAETGLQAMADAVLAAVPRHAAWLGWSMGGLVAAQAALAEPAAVEQLVMLAATPSFVRRPGWQAAMLPVLLQAFAEDLQQDYRKTLQRFLALQVRGSEAAGGVLRELRARLLERGEPAPAALLAGLEILHGSDLRQRLGDIRCPALYLMGERDSLVPVAAATQAAQLMPQARVEVIAGAGHAPFLAAPGAVAGVLREFLLPGAVVREAECHG